MIFWCYFSISAITPEEQNWGIKPINNSFEKIGSPMQRKKMKENISLTQADVSDLLEAEINYGIAWDNREKKSQETRSKAKGKVQKLQQKCPVQDK